MSTTKFKGEEVKLNGEIPQEGSEASDFRYVKADLSEGTLKEMNGVKVLIGVPSLDTGVCAAEAKAFNNKLKNMNGVTGLIISKDLPFAMKRFCEAEGVNNVSIASDFRYNEFTNNYNTEMKEGPLKGLSSRAVFVLDKENKIRFEELVSEVTNEPDYDKVMTEVEKLL